jgi:hypothetical protein
VAWRRQRRLRARPSGPADLGTGFGAGVTRDDIIAGMRNATMLKRLPTLTDVG